MEKANIILKDEIRNLFNLMSGSRETFKCLLSPDNYDCYYITDGDMKGVGFEISKEHRGFRYNFENIIIKVDERINNNKEKKYFIELLSERLYDVDEFLFICLKFLEPGESGVNRKMILENPQSWVDKWKNLFGNKNGDDKVYPYIGELLVLRHLLTLGKNAKLTSQGSHDIETKSENYEVKTTTMRYDSLIEIHSKNQLAKLNNNPLFLYFVRIEESEAGVSINSLLKDLKRMNYDVNDVNERIKDLNSISLTKCYKIDEIREYEITESFPKIIDESFVEGHLPNNIISIKYTIDLNGIEYRTIESNN